MGHTKHILVKPLAKAELLSRVSKMLRDNDLRKDVSQRKIVFHISDDFENRADFYIPLKNRSAIYNTEDVENILSAFAAVTYEALSNGEAISWPGYWEVEPRKRLGRIINPFGTGEMIETPTKYIAKFNPGPRLREAAQLYGMKVEGAYDEDDDGYAVLEDLSDIDDTFDSDDERAEYEPAVRFVEHTDGDSDGSGD